MAGSEIIGLVGLPLAGKSTVAQLFSEKGFHVIDVDKVGHATLELAEVKECLATEFGAEVIDQNTGLVNRGKVADIVFADEGQLLKLESIVHPRMSQAVRMESEKYNKVIIDAALLFIMGLDEICDKVILVEADENARTDRARNRGWSLENLRRREKRLRDNIEKRRSDIDIVIDNSDGQDILKKNVDTICEREF